MALEPYIGLLFLILHHSLSYFVAKCHTINGFMKEFCNPVYFGLKVVSAKFLFLNAFQSFVFSAISPFGRMSFGHISILSFVFQPYDHSAKCLSAICF